MSPASNSPEAPRRRSVIRAAPNIARLGVFVWWRTTEWTVETVARAGTRAVRSTLAGEPPREILRDARDEARLYARRLLGILDTANGDRDTPPSPDWDATPTPDEPAEAADNGRPLSLRERGAELLRRSADVHLEEDFHPAYQRILDDLAPDEGRILRLLAQGSQPAVDVRSGLPLASTLIAPGLTMIGAEAGCRTIDRVPSYLHNLFRLGLVWFSRERIEDLLRYQVLEAQPEVVESLRVAGRTGRTVRRSIHLTAFGEDFCAACLPVDTEELDALPGREESD